MGNLKYNDSLSWALVMSGAAFLIGLCVGSLITGGGL